MSKTSIQELGAFGQSIWLDYVSRSLIETGKLEAMIQAGLRGMTSNPTIFEKAISQSKDYDERIKELSRAGKSTFDIYDNLTVQDVQDAADIFLSVFEGTKGIDGYVSLEINPELAMKTRETIAEGKRLHKKVNRPNVMFKVPATDAGFGAVEELLSEGINSNVTLIFSPKQYKKTVKAYLKGIDELLHKGGNLSTVCSVASVFVSRIDTAVDKIIEERVEKERDESIKTRLQNLRGKAAVANSNIIYKKYLKKISSGKFQRLQEKGARIQRVLWGSTGTKNQAYSDIKYVTELIGKNTVNTVPEQTFNSFLEHGTAQETLTFETSAAKKILHDLEKFDIDIDNICAKLLQDGVAAFTNSFQSLLSTIEEKAKLA